ncbi:MAG TPA: DUF1810 domain-containing protein [Polyangiaceae bacterium]|jgi:uncharacterized protein (DUF1810 family)|nr:DUF1810 domain-containing protein [Polyangiaceae bacterium]
MSDDPHQLQRFVTAQAPVYASVVAELRRGSKEGHWMWFVFPQLKGLGLSSMAQRYAIRSRAEAVAYSQHPTLGRRLLECTRLVNALRDRTLFEIFDTPDDLKFRSSMTLFAQAAEDARPFLDALDRYCDGQPDPRTLQLWQAL